MKICFNILVILIINCSCKESWKCGIDAFGSNMLTRFCQCLIKLFDIFILFIYYSLI